ncbi:MAG: AEC family transporter [Clostridium sp.]
MNFSGLYEMQGMLFLLMIIGAVLKKIGIITDEGKSVLADIVIYVTLPCSILKSFEIEFNRGIIESSIVILMISCLIQAGCYILNLFVYGKMEPAKKKVLRYATMTSNAGILGNPIAEGIFGSMGLFYASIYLIPQRAVMWSLGMTYFTEAPNRRTLIKKVCTHPCILAVFFGFLMMLCQYRLPGFLGATVKSLSNANTAVSMMFVGTVLASAKPSELVNKVTCYYSAIRLFIIPGFVLLGCSVVGIDPLIIGVSVVLSGMPAASVTAILASKYGGDDVFATKCVVFSTLLSMITVPLWCMVL